MNEGEAHSLKTKFGRFLIVGGINTGLMWLLYLFLVLVIDWHYTVALAVDYVCGILLGYVMNRYWTFASHGRQINSFPRYALTYVVLFFFNLLLLGLLVEMDLLGPVTGQLVAFSVVTVCSFVSQNYWVFRRGGD